VIADAPELVGRTIRARVERVEEFGVFLSDSDVRILVLIIDISDSPITDLVRAFRIGEEVDVRILKYVSETGIYKGSMKPGNAARPLTG
jgi:ribosomal protein S1